MHIINSDAIALYDEDGVLTGYDTTDISTQLLGNAPSADRSALDGWFAAVTKWKRDVRVDERAVDVAMAAAAASLTLGETEIRGCEFARWRGGGGGGGAALEAKPVT